MTVDEIKKELEKVIFPVENYNLEASLFSFTRY